MNSVDWNWYGLFYIKVNPVKINSIPFDLWNWHIGGSYYYYFIIPINLSFARVYRSMIPFSSIQLLSYITNLMESFEIVIKLEHHFSVVFVFNQGEYYHTTNIEPSTWLTKKNRISVEKNIHTIKENIAITSITLEILMPSYHAWIERMIKIKLTYV